MNTTRITSASKVNLWQGARCIWGGGGQSRRALPQTTSPFGSSSKTPRSDSLLPDTVLRKAFIAKSEWGI